MKVFRDRLWILVAVFLTNLSFCLHAGEIVSRPAAVTIKNIDENSRSLVSVPYQLAGLNDIISPSSLTGVVVLAWNNAKQQYESFAPTSDVSSFLVEPGTAFWVLNNLGNTQTVAFSGTLNLEPTNGVILPQGLSLVGLPYFLPVPLDASGLAGLVDDKLTDSLGNSVTNLMPGEGYWYLRKGQADRLWVETRPFSNIFPAEGLLPSIAGIRIKNGGSAAILTIKCDNSITALDVYYKDQPPGASLDLGKGWLIAATDIPVTGNEIVEWVDEGSSDRKPINEISTRLYLVGNAGMLGADKIPICRSMFVLGKSASVLSNGNSRKSLSVSESQVSSNLVAGADGAKAAVAVSSGRIIFVDKINGGDTLSGVSPVTVGTNGPRKSIKGGLGVTQEGDTMIIKSGIYNESLNVSGKNVQILIQGNVKL